MTIMATTLDQAEGDVTIDRIELSALPAHPLVGMNEITVRTSEGTVPNPVPNTTEILVAKTMNVITTRPFVLKQLRVPHHHPHQPKTVHAGSRR